MAAAATISSSFVTRDSGTGQFRPLNTTTEYATLTSGKDRVFDFGAWNFPWAGVMIGVVAHVVLIVVGYLVSLVFQRNAVPARAMTLWGWLDRLRAAVTTP